MGWFERETMPKMSTIDDENTFRPTTRLVLLIYYLDAKCFISQVNPKRKPATKHFMHTMKIT